MSFLSLNPVLETLYIMVGAYMSYALAHLPVFQLSGDVAIFFYGIMMSHYNKFNMNFETFKNIGLSLNLMMMMAEMICFVYIGLSLTDAFIDHYENIIAALILLAGWLAGRALMLGAFAYFLSKSNKMRIRGKEWAYLITSGLIKGPLAYIFANIIVAKSVPCIDTSNKTIYKTV